VDQQGSPEVAEDRRPLPGPFGVVGGDADVECLALAHGRIERTHRLLQRRRSVQPVAVEVAQVDMPDQVYKPDGAISNSGGLGVVVMPAEGHTNCDSVSEREGVFCLVVHRNRGG
jgi:hypothetical protein